MKQAAAGAASATQAVKADKKPFFTQRTLPILLISSSFCLL